MNEKFGVIYKITNKINGKIYIGQTIQPIKTRWDQHTRKDNCTYLGNAIQKYGKENFTTEVIGTFLQELLNLAEVAAIKEHNSLSPNGYNLTSGGVKGTTLSEETLKKMSESRSGEKHHFFGKHLSKETRARMSESHKGLKSPHSEETKRKISKGNLGKKRSAEVRKKLSNKKIGTKLSEETKLKISKSHIGLKASDETKRKISLAGKGRKHFKRHS